ncbi:predicted protein [Plenodomus lingam JN3]|uniref:Predicted protein n=1 Tax=Leptosphaeria maculans (strain JN3 / isolate v23.1.3 / race Av1-4-5-6-7-8) TaxID=985895 RepID=E5A058_LEPMJ|nr:predicted protein [Plenodomus lingam JN3]CBX96918.1 predicted protein [Plenodomus lingam JN3]
MTPASPHASKKERRPNSNIHTLLIALAYASIVQSPPPHTTYPEGAVHITMELALRELVFSIGLGYTKLY